MIEEQQPQQPPAGTVADLGRKVKQKYPGTYDALSDDEVGRKVKAKYPGAYDSFVDQTPQQPVAPAVPGKPPAPSAPMVSPSTSVAGSSPAGSGAGQMAQAAFDEAFSRPLPPVKGFVPEQPKQGPTPDSEFDRASKLDPRAVGAVYGDYELPDDYGDTKPIPGADPSTFKRGDLQAAQERAKQKDAQAGPVRAWVTASNRVLDYEKEFSSLVEQADALRANGNIREADAIQARIGRAAEGVTKNKEFAAVAQKQAEAIFSTVAKDFKESTEMLSGKFFREQEGVRVVDAENITKYVNERLVDMGLMDSNGRYNTDIDPSLDVKHTLASRLMAEAENHQRERVADQALKAKLGERRIAMTEDVAKSFSSVAAVEAQLSAEAKNYSAGAKADVSKYEATTVNPAVTALKKTYDGSVAHVNAEADRINKLYEAGQITYEQANQAIDQANQGLQQATDAYNSGVDQLLKSSNEEVANINFRWNSKFKQEQESRFAAFEKSQEAFQEEFRAKYGDDSNLIRELNRAYNDAWQKQAEKEDTNKGKERAAYERYMKDVPGVRQMNRFYETFDEGLGGWYKTMGVTLGSSDMYDAGVRAENKYMLPERDHKGVDDLLTVGWLETQGRLAGRMFPNIVATGLTAAATAPLGGVGGAATATRLAVTAARWGLSGGVGYVMETSDIAAQMRMDVLDKTGDIVKANKAADRVWEAQTAIAWSYLMEGAPFLKLPFAPKSRILGGLMGFGAEFGQEFFLQEGPQQMAEKRITAEAEGKRETITEGIFQLREGLTAAYDDFYGGIKEMAKEGVNPRTGERQPSELEMLAVDLSGMGLLGVPGGVMSASQARNAKADMLKSYAADEVVAKYAEYGDMSWLNSLVEKRGAEFASELADVFRAAGQLDVVQHLDLKRKIESVSKAQADASSAKLMGDQKDAYTAIAAKVYEHRNAAANAESEISRKTHEARASEAEKMLIGIATGKDEKYFMVEHPNGKKVFMTETEGRDMLNDFESFQTLTMLGMQSDGGVKITAYGAGNDVVLTQAWEAMLEWQEAMDRGVGRVSHRYGVDVEWTPSGLVVKAREGVSPQDAYDAEAILSRMGYKVKGFIAPLRQAPLNEEDVVDVVTKEPPTAQADIDAAAGTTGSVTPQAIRAEGEVKTLDNFQNENEFYRVIVGDEAFNDIVDTGAVRTNADSKVKPGATLAEKLAARPTAFPSFSKGSASIEYAEQNPNNYIIVTSDPSIKPSTSGRHGKGSTMFPTDENGNPLAELSGEKIKVYKHIGNNEYVLVYENGKVVSPAAKGSVSPVDGEMTVKSFAESIASGNRLDTPEAVQFYENNKKEIEAELQRMAGPQKQAPQQAPVDPNDDAEVTLDEEVADDPDALLEEAMGVPREVVSDEDIDAEMAKVSKATGAEVVGLDQDEYTEAVDKVGGDISQSLSGGFFMGRNGKIYINRDRFRRGVVAHEGTHAIIFNAVLSGNPNGKAIISSSAKQALESSPKAKEALIDFLGYYGGAKKKEDGTVDIDATIADEELAEEVMSEFVAALYNGSIKLDNAMRQFIRDLYNRIMAALGVSTKVEFKEDGDFIAAAKQIASAMKAGRKIETGKKAGGSGTGAGSKFSRLAARTPGTKARPYDHNLAAVDPAAVDMDAMSDKALNKAADMLAKYPGMRIGSGSAKTRIAKAIDRMVGNILYLHDSFPEDVRKLAKEWYVGANKVSLEWAKTYGVTPAQTAGVIAALSPQKDWFTNMSLAERVLDFVTNHRDHKWDSAMSDRAQKIKDDYTDKIGKAKKSLAKNPNNDKKRKELRSYESAVEKLDIAIPRISGKVYSDLTSGNDKAWFLRIWDEANNDPSFNQYLPTGEKTVIQRNKAPKPTKKNPDPVGVPSKIAWQNAKSIAAAIDIAENGTSIDVVSRGIGEAHKVRSFYNNIFDPSSPDFTTIDTHAMAAAMFLPLSGSSPITTAGFGGLSDSASGHSGLYPIYQRAYEIAAKQRGLLPREMQSITWEAVRGLFEKGQKAGAGSSASDVWKAMPSDPDGARAAVSDLFGGISTPGWMGSELQEADKPKFSKRQPDGSLNGLPRKFKVGGKEMEASHWKPAEDVAISYMKKAGLPYNPPSDYVEVDPDRAKRIADEYEKMKHDPENPEVAADFDALDTEVLAQYDEIIEKTGLDVEIMDPLSADPYNGNPWGSTVDIRDNNHVWVYPSDGGYGPFVRATPSDFSKALEAARASMGAKDRGQVSSLPKDFKGRLFLYSGGKAGFGIADDGELIGLFKSAGGPSGMMDQALQIGKGLGGTHLWAFDTYLASSYAKRGAKETERIKWNDEYAPSGWDKSTMGTPDVVRMDLDGVKDLKPLQKTGRFAGDHELTKQELFRTVHDYFGHVKEGVGFRANGEENAWRVHSSMLTPPAQRALTTLTRGQNSWVNYGPYGEKNRTAKSGETVYADQKIGLMPMWVSEDGRNDSVSEADKPKFSKATPGKNRVPQEHRDNLTDDGKGNYVFFHKGPAKLKGGKIDPAYFGTGKTKDNRSNPVMNYYTKPDQGERMIKGDVTYAVPVPKWKVYPLMSDPLDLYDKAEANFRKKFGKDQAFDAVRQADFIGPLAEKAGFDMMIAGWSMYPLRAESGKSLAPDAKLTKKYEEEGVVDLTKSVDPYYEKLMAKARADRDKQNAKEAKGFGGPKFSKKTPAEVRAGAEKVKAMTNEDRDNYDPSEDDNYEGYSLYEAEKLVPKPTEKPKRVTDSNSFNLWSDWHSVINVDGVVYGLTKYEDPDAISDEEDSAGFPKEYVWAYARMDDQLNVKSTVTNDVAELVSEIKGSSNIKFSGASPENIAKALIAKGYNTKAKAREYMVSKGADRMVDQVMAEFDKLRDAAAARKASAQVTPTPPATPTPPSTTRQDGGGRPMRGSAKRMKEQYPELYAALGEDTIYYDRMPMTVTRDAASELVGWLGLERAKDEVLNRSSDIPDAVRAMMGRMVMKQLADEHRLAELDTFAENFFKLGTSAGQFINALRDVYEEFSKDMIFYRIQRIVEKEVEKKKGKDKNYKKLRDGLTKVNKEVAEEVIRTRKVRDKATDASFPKPDPSKKPKTTPAYGTKNKVVKKSQYDQAWRELSSMLPSGVAIPQLVTIATYHIEAGSRSFADVAERVIAKGGRKLLPYLKGSYKQAAKDMGIEPSTDAEIDEYINKANTDKIVDKLRKAIKAKDKKSEAAAIAALQQVAKDDGLWGKYRKEAVSRLTRLADQDIKDDIQKDTIIAEFTAGLVRNITDQMKKEAEAKGLESKEPKTPKPAIEIIGDAYRNFDKYEQVWKDTQSEWKRRLNAAEARLAKATTPEAKQKAQADIVNEQSRLDRLDAYYGELMIKPFSEAAIGRAVKDGMKELDQKIDDIIRQHYTVYEAAKQTLADKLVQGAGLTEVEATKLADTVKAEFERLATERKKALVEQYAKRKFGDKKTARPKAGIEEELILLSNTSAFSDKEFAEKYGEMRGWPRLTEADIAELNRLSDRIQTAKEGRPKLEATEDLLSFQENLAGVSKWEIAQSVWFANLLSGFGTQLVNFMSNQANVAFEMAVYAAKSTAKGKPMDGLNAARLLGYAYKRAYYEGDAVLRTGYSPIRGRVDIPPALERYKFPKYLAMYSGLKAVRRIMVGADVIGFEPLKELRAYQYAAMKARSVDPSPIDMQRALDIMNRNDESIANAEAQAKSEYKDEMDAIDQQGLTGVARKKAVAKAERDRKRRAFELVEKGRDPEVVQESARFAARSTFNYTPEGFLGSIAKHLNGLLRDRPELRYVVPFVNIIANVTNEALNYDPFIGGLRAYYGGSIFDTRSGKANKGMTEAQKKMHREDLITKASIGLFLQVAFLLLSHPGDDEDPLIEITANGFNNYKQNSEMESKGLWKPYSFRFRGTDTWISYRYTPLLFNFALIGHLRDAEKYRKERLDDAMYTKYAVAFSRNITTITDATFLSTTADALGWINDVKEDGFEGLAKSAAKTVKAMVIPYSALLSQMQQNIDSAFDIPKLDARGSLAVELIRNTPVAYFVRDKYPIRLDALGDPIVPTGGMFNRLLTTSDPSPSKLQEFFMAAPAPDEYWSLMIEKRYPLSAPAKNRLFVYDPDLGKDRFLTDDELFTFYRERGEFMKTSIKENFDALSKADNKEFAKAMAKIGSMATTIAKAKATGVELENFRIEE